MKNLLYYKMTIAVLAVVAGSLGYYFIENQSKIKDYECKSDEINETLNIQYEKGVKKMRFISIIEKEGAKETILGYEYDAYEKSGELLFENYQKPIGGDMFLGLKDMKLRLDYKVWSGEPDYMDIEKTRIYDCKRI